MKIKKIAASILTVTTLALMGISTQTQTVNAAVASIDTSSVIYITNNNGAQLYSLSNDTMSTTSRSLANKSAWITNKITNVNGVTYYSSHKHMGCSYWPIYWSSSSFFRQRYVR